MYCLSSLLEGLRNTDKMRVCTRSVPKVRGLPSKLSFLLSDFHEIQQNITLMSNEFFGIFYKAE